MTLLIRTNGSQEVIASPSIDEARKIVGGSLSVVCLSDEKIIICNAQATADEGQNITASKILSLIKQKPHGIIGDVILTDNKFLHQYGY
jgi:hypothetical protein